MPFVSYPCRHTLFHYSCLNCGQAFLNCPSCFPDELICSSCKQLMLAPPCSIDKFYRGVKMQERIHSNQIKHLSKIKSSIRRERGIHITASGSRYTPARMEKRRQAQRAFYAKHAEKINTNRRDHYHSDLELSRSKEREKYYLNERNKEKRRIYDQLNKKKINARKRDYYSRNRVRLQTKCRLRRSDPVYREHQNQLDKLRRLRKSKK